MHPNNSCIANKHKEKERKKEKKERKKERKGKYKKESAQLLTLGDEH